MHILNKQQIFTFIQFGLEIYNVFCMGSISH
jgi:hypothetical protein